MLSILLYLVCAIYDPHQAELDRIVKQHKEMGHPALSAWGIDLNEHGKMQSQGYVFIFHDPAEAIVSGTVITKDGARILIISMPSGILPSKKAKQGVKQ